MFQQATTQKKRSTGSALASQIERNRDQGRFCDDDWVDGRLLELAGQQHCYGAVVVLVVCIMMDELMQTRTDGQDRGPLKHGGQKQ
jgi:hypothetical protein